MSAPPSGTVTFLFTDIEGSTRLAQQYPAVWSSAQARHHALVRTAIEAHGGYIFQVIGDALCAAFHTASDALATALDAQRALHAEPWGDAVVRVRMGIHSGAAEFRDGDYQGYLTLAQVQRVMSVAHGSQILLSSAATALLAGQQVADVTLRDMGEHHLKGLLNPERLWQVLTPGLPHDFPPLSSLHTTPNNLPILPTSFIGREREIIEGKRLLSGARLLTLTGSGGTGKTRLSLQIAAEVLDTFPNGVWLIELAALSDPGLLPQSVANALGLHEPTSQPVLETLGAYAADKQMLLLLDNCEHLIEACARLADHLLRACPQVKVLVTSREALGIAGETIFLVPSLQLPLPDAQAAPDRLAHCESVRLFVERAVSIKPDFQLTSTNATAVAQICRRLDGIPLAIELAVARLRSLSADQINARLDNQFRLLTGGSRTALPRQQTLRALVDWSHNLLSDVERVLFRRLAVFAGGWTLDGAEAICSAEALPAMEVVNTLDQLVNKSLVAADEHSAQSRYRMLETIRQYAREKLLEAGEGDPVRGRHLAFYVQWAEAGEPRFHNNEQAVWLERLETEHENIRPALEWSLAGADGANVELGLRLAGALGDFWLTRGYVREGQDWLERLLGVSDRSAVMIRAKAMRQAGAMARVLRDQSRSKERYEASLSRSNFHGLGATVAVMALSVP